MREVWIDSTLGRVCDVQVGPAFKSEVFRSAPDGTRLLRGINLGPQGTRWDEVYLWPDERLEEFRRFSLNEGDVCIAMDATFTSGGQIRAAQMTSADLPALLVQRVARLRARPDLELDQGFLALVVGSGTFRGHLSDRQTGAFAPHISATDLKSFPIALPPLSVQRRIVDLMAHLDEHLGNLRTEYQAAFTLVERLRASLTQAWTRVPLGEVCRIEAKLVDPRLEIYQALPHVGIEHMIRNGGGLLPLSTTQEASLVSNKYLFSDEDVVFAKIRPNLRKVEHPGRLGLCSADAYPLRPSEGITPSLLREVLLITEVTDQVVAKSGRTKMPKINRRELFTVLVPMTEDRSERQRVGAVLDTARSLHQELAEEITSLATVRSALLDALCAGTVSLPEAYDSFLASVA
jgi:restriction endonuclease S subunit